MDMSFITYFITNRIPIDKKISLAVDYCWQRGGSGKNETS